MTDDEKTFFCIGARVSKYLQDFNEYQLSNSDTAVTSDTMLFTLNGRRTTMGGGGLGAHVNCKTFDSDTLADKTFTGFTSETFTSETYRVYSAGRNLENLVFIKKLLADFLGVSVKEIEPAKAFVMACNDSSTVLIDANFEYLRLDYPINTFADLFAQNVLYGAGLKPKTVSLPNCPFRRFLFK